MPKARLHDGHDILLSFLKERGQSWDTVELVDALHLPQDYLNRLGKDLAEHDLIDLVRNEQRRVFTMRAKRSPT